MQCNMCLKKHIHQLLLDILELFCFLLSGNDSGRLSVRQGACLLCSLIQWRNLHNTGALPDIDQEE